ncbi:MAG: hypothetical protein COB51_13775 [Moraxellaceae bacterium]|nr:MAG: hypothetical protein COB51_13775 [Moraxellaceae bacterium]
MDRIIYTSSNNSVNKLAGQKKTIFFNPSRKEGSSASILSFGGEFIFRIMMFPNHTLTQSRKEVFWGEIEIQNKVYA